MGWDNDYYNHMNNGHGFYGVGMGLLFLVFLGFIIWAILKIGKIETKSNSLQFPPHKESPLEIIDRRLANGEMNAEEYQVAKELLSQK